MERYAQLMEDLEILNLMKKEFEDDIEMTEYLEFKIKETQNELTQIDNAWTYKVAAKLLDNYKILTNYLDFKSDL